MLISSPRLPLKDSAGNELRALLAPITPEIFVRDYWARKPLLVKGFPAKYAGFFGAEAFSRLLSEPGPFPDDFLRASFDRKTGTGASAAVRLAGELRSSAFRASPEQAVPLFDAGATLCVSQIETRVAALRPFVAAVKRQLGYPGKVSFNAYLSPPGAGFNWHFDSRIASTLQIEGTKVWRFSDRPALAWPRGNGTLRADGSAQYTDPSIVAHDWEQLEPVDERNITEVLLEPGDLLILPAGTWHEACGGVGGSLALNLSFTPISYTVLIRNLLDTLLTADAGWRGPEPLLPGDAAGEADPAGIAAISAQLARAAELLGALRGDSAAVVRLWQSLVQSSAAASPLSGKAMPPDGPIAQSQRLRLRADRNVYALLADGGSRLCLTVGADRPLELTGAAKAFVERILFEREFVAGDCLTWNAGGSRFAWSEVQELLTNLRREGLIENN